MKHRADFINNISLTPDSKLVHQTAVRRCAKITFGVMCNKRKYTKTKNRDVKYKWARSRNTICKQF